MSGAENDLWAEVLMRGLQDARASLDAIVCGSETLARREARAWVGSRDFDEVCRLAGLEPTAVLDRWQADKVDFHKQRYVKHRNDYRNREGDAVRRRPSISLPAWEVAAQ